MKKNAKPADYIITDIDLTPAQLKARKKQDRKDMLKGAAIGAVVGVTIGLVFVVVDAIRHPEQFEEIEEED